MSNKLINAVIALIEERPKDAREMLRSPEMKVSVSELQSRLNLAIEKREAIAQVQALKLVIAATIRIDMNLVHNRTDDQKERYLEGVAYVEEIIDNLIASLESKVLA